MNTMMFVDIWYEYMPLELDLALIQMGVDIVTKALQCINSTI